MTTLGCALCNRTILGMPSRSLSPAFARDELWTIQQMLSSTTVFRRQNCWEHMRNRREMLAATHGLDPDLTAVSVAPSRPDGAPGDVH
jgi:hypothetical protein